MRTFPLKIVTPVGLAYEGEARSLTVRTTAGDVGILAGHADYTASVAKGTARITDKNGDTKTAKCDGGILNISDGKARLVADEFEWEV